MTQWQRIYNHLKQDGFDVYSPGQHKGECITPYIVLKDDGVVSNGEYSSVIAYYDVLCYVPKDRFSTLEEYTASVQLSLKKLFPELKPTNDVTSSYLDTEVNGHMISMRYRSNRKIYL